jgi:hypothetical protein
MECASALFSRHFPGWSQKHVDFFDFSITLSHTEAPMKPEPYATNIQLSFLPTLAQNDRDPQAVTGCWSAGERLLQVQGRGAWVNVWFHFFEGGEAILSFRPRNQPPTRVHGQWWIENNELVSRFSTGAIRASYNLQEDILQWAGETLLRMPESAASLPYGIKLPYRISHQEFPIPKAPVSTTA